MLKRFLTLLLFLLVFILPKNALADYSYTDSSGADWYCAQGTVMYWPDPDHYNGVNNGYIGWAGIPVAIYSSFAWGQPNGGSAFTTVQTDANGNWSYCGGADGQYEQPIYTYSGIPVIPSGYCYLTTTDNLSGWAPASSSYCSNSSQSQGNPTPTPSGGGASPTPTPVQSSCTISGPTTVSYPGQAVTYTANVGTPADTTNLNYSWTFDPNWLNEGGQINISSDSQTATLTPPTNPQSTNYSVQLNIYNQSGTNQQCSLQISVTPAVTNTPVPTNTPTPTGTPVSAACSFVASDTTVAPNQQTTLTNTTTITPITYQKWQATGGQFTNNNSSPTNWSNQTPGNYTLTLTVCDNNSTPHSCSNDIAVNSNAPTPPPTPTPTPTPSGPIQSLSVTNASNSSFSAAIFGASGKTTTEGGHDYYNPINITLGTSNQDSVSDSYVAFYDKNYPSQNNPSTNNLTSTNTFLCDMENRLNIKPSAGLLLHYNKDTKTYEVWDPTNGSGGDQTCATPITTGGWTNITNYSDTGLYYPICDGACVENGSTIQNATYEVSPGNTAHSWLTKFHQTFGQKTMTTAGFVKLSDGTTNLAASLTPPTPQGSIPLISASSGASANAAFASSATSVPSGFACPSH